MKTQKLLAVIVVLQIVTILNQWFGGPISHVQAQVPDAGAQRFEIIDQLKAENVTLSGVDDKLDKLVTIFQSGKVQVEIAKPDDNDGK